MPTYPSRKPVPLAGIQFSKAEAAGSRRQKPGQDAGDLVAPQSSDRSISVYAYRRRKRSINGGIAGARAETYPGRVRKSTPEDTVRTRQAVPRIALTRAHAALALGMSIDSFERYVQPEIPAIRKGRLRLFRVSDLERWAATNASFVLDRGK